MEIVYFLCILGSFVVERTAKGTELHHSLFETLPGFIWISISSVILGALYMLVFAVVFGSYIVWMHNSSIKK